MIKLQGFMIITKGKGIHLARVNGWNLEECGGN